MLLIIRAFLVGGVLTAACAEEPRWCQERPPASCPECPASPPLRVECTRTDVEGCEARYAQLGNEYADVVETYTDERRCPALQRCLTEAANSCFLSRRFWCMPGPNLPPMCEE